MAEYFEKLKDPRWQRKRLEVMQRADFTCEYCSDSGETLHVHHGYYEKNREPWDYPDAAYHCVCDTCHKAAETIRVEVRAMVGCMGMESQNQLHEALRSLQEVGEIEVLLLLTKLKRVSKKLAKRAKQ